ncbi:TPA: relaxase/mobilization nuclease domain-containing protein [Campylobacter coli]|nr:relaxase/mobilization nuclease domain-containing protein [Campylobacter coli]HEH4585422.1 relaxase/mobilization nuclease domain-containing protein [Campylobacter coli]HEH4589024.1 relaxase/mobilization nuclease domain-containing protein [Campylobacter coli]HEH4611490.1 relaxase/mobilization nuclease domain-containing protein [Campylobacter coli]HEH4618209.1 relaxase/mobilization nuclease domain-containing protein [Campylobacter coli]
MIIKKIPSKKQNKSSFKNLSNYILDKDNNNAKVLVDYMLDKNNEMDKVEGYHFTNCSFDNDEDNINEIINTQKLNTTTKQDKTLHLVVSFQEDEKPTLEILQTIEEEIAKSLGMSDHQRLSVIHSNTNNLHIHIAINKVNPHTLKVINPYNDVRILQETAMKLEKKYNLKLDNHISQKDKQSNKYNIHTMNCNFETWVKEKLSKQVDLMLKDEKTTFKDIKQLLAKYDLEFRERRKGFVIASKSEKLFCKASSIYRELSKQALEKRFKELDLKQEKENTEKIEEEKQEIKERYQRPNKETSKALWEKYLRIENEKKAELDKELRMLKLRRNEFKTSIPSMKFSKETFKHVKNQRMIFKNKQKELYQKYKRVSYRDFLISESLSGNEEATRALRRSKTKINENENTLSSEQEKPKIFENVDYITKEGYAVYKSGFNKAIDKGEMLKVSLINGKDDKEFLLNSLLMAIDRFGNHLNITGDENFKRNILEVANDYNLNVSFTDPQMQKIQEGNNDKRQEMKARKILKNIIELKIKLTEQDTNIEDSVKEKELKALKFSLKKISDSTLLIFEGELKKIGFSRDEINSMDMQSVDTQIEGFIVNSINKKGLNAMNEEIKKTLRDDEERQRFEKFEYLFLNTDKVADVTKGFYANRKIDVDGYIEKFSMQESKISKVANAISMLSDKNIEIMEKYVKKLEKDLKYQYLKKAEVIESNDINLNNF